MKKLKKVQFGWLARHLIPNAGTLIVIGLFLLTQSVGARPSTAPLLQGAILLNYQGTLADSSGNPINGNVEMVFDLYYEVEGGTSFWTEAYTGAQAIEVTSGQFHVLLGSQVALNPTDLTGDLYLGITVNGEEMLPREMLTSVVRAVGITGDLDMNGHDITSIGELTIKGTGQSIITNPQDVTDSGGAALRFGSDSTWLGIDNNEITAYGDALHLQHSGATSPVDTGTDLIVRKNNIYLGGSGNGRVALRQDSSRILHLLPWGGASYNYDNVCIGCGSKAGLMVRGSVSCGALTEANLQTPEELASERIDRFEEGDVLCWSSDRLEKCSESNDPLVQAVADVDGRPIVIGAEIIKVLGPVKTGDILVASDVPGFAMVNNDPRPGTVIAQVLEDFDGEQGLVKAMIRKW